MGGNGGQPPLRLPLTLRGGEGSFPTMALTQNAERNQGLLYAKGPGRDRWVSSPLGGLNVEFYAWGATQWYLLTTSLFNAVPLYYSFPV